MRPLVSLAVAILLANLSIASGTSPPGATAVGQPGIPAAGAPPAEPLATPSFPSLAAALADLGLAVGSALPAEDLVRAEAFEARLAPEAAAAIADLAGALAAASRARPLAVAEGGGDAALLASASATVGQAAERASATLRSLLAEGRCMIDCAAASPVICLPVVGCLPGPGFLPPLPPPAPCLPAVGSLDPTCITCPPGQAGLPPLCIGPPGACPAGSAGTPPACVPNPPAFSPCAAAALLAVPFTVAPLFSFGTAAAEGFDLDVILSIDLGGNDAYCNNAGSTKSAGPPHDVLGVPRCTEFTPAAVLLDFAGNDAYHSVYANIAETDTVPLFCFEGSSDAGIAWFQDVEGDDDYNSKHLVVNAGGGQGWCNGQFKLANYPDIVVQGLAYYDAVTTQGATVSGFGYLEDQQGDDEYNSDNVVCSRYYTGACLRIHLAQGAAHLPTGQGSMQEILGSDDYNSHNRVVASAQSITPLPVVTVPPAPPPPCLPVQPQPPLPLALEDAWMLIRDVQGAALLGFGDLHDHAGGDEYNGANAVDADWLVGALVPVPTKPARLAIECSQGCGVLGGTGRHVDDGGDPDTYNDGNAVTVTDSPLGSHLGIRCAQGVTAEGTPYPAETHCVAPGEDCTVGCGGCGVLWDCPPEAPTTAITPEGTQGVLQDMGGDDRYNSRNTASAGQNNMPMNKARLGIQQAQGSSEGGEARFEDVTGGDTFNGGNTAAASDGTAVLAIDAVQGNVRSLLGAGTMLSDWIAPGATGDDYNGGNTVTGNFAGQGRMRITNAQATSSAPPVSLATARLHEGHGDDKYNTGNGPVGSLLQILGAQAALGRSPAVPYGGFVAFEDDRGADQYNTGNTFGACAAATGTCIDWTTCVGAGLLSLTVTFLDTTAGPVDTWNAAAPAYGHGMYNNPASTVPPANCNDTGDGAEMPANTFGTDT